MRNCWLVLFSGSFWLFFVIFILLEPLVAFLNYSPRRSFDKMILNKRILNFRSVVKFNSFQLRSILNYYSVKEDELKVIFQGMKQPAFRIKQINNWVFEKGVTNFDDMKDLPASLREQLKETFRFGSLTLVTEQVSKDGTKKRAYSLPDGQLIETVLMTYEDGRNTACISSQAGCAMGCTFCATGQMGFSRQLTASEIFEQAQQFSLELKIASKRLSNIVFMGMGEPLANFKNVLAAIHRINDELGIGMRHITVSTVGIIPRIKQLADEGIQVNLAVSLHQANDESRSQLMPVNEKYPLHELIEACQYYAQMTNRRITFEWALIAHKTDTVESAHELGHLLQPLLPLCHVNVIPLNPTDGYSGRPSSPLDVERFVNILEKQYRVPTTIRVRRGIDINAGCGQLTAELMRARKVKLENETTSSAAEVVAVPPVPTPLPSEKRIEGAEKPEKGARKNIKI
jgi:23S rRNA (adenine2503-C2)-methyltransferase